MMIGESTAHWPIFPQTAPGSVLSAGEGHVSLLQSSGNSSGVWAPVFPQTMIGLLVVKVEGGFNLCLRLLLESSLGQVWVELKQALDGGLLIDLVHF